MDSDEELKKAEFEDRVASLSRLHAHILFWMMRGLDYDEIGRILDSQGVIDQEWDGDTVQRELTQIYEALGYTKEMAPKTKNAALKKYAFPAIKLLTNDDPKELDKFPLKQKPENAQNRQSVDNLRQRVDNNRQKIWILVGVLFLALLVGAFLLGHGINPPPPPSTPVLTNTQGILATDTLMAALTNTVIATFTSAPSQTLTPTTSALTPTLTLTPVPTNTTSPINLTKGAVLQNDGKTLKFKDFKFEQGRTRTGQRPPAPILFEFDFTNNSGGQILLELTQDKFRAEDNLGNQLTCEFWNNVTEAVETIQQPLDNGKTWNLGVFCGEGKIPPGVTTYTLYVTGFSTLPDSTWIANVPR